MNVPITTTCKQLFITACESLIVHMLKRIAKAQYMAYKESREHNSEEAEKHRQAFNTTMDKLASIDVNCPKFRL